MKKWVIGLLVGTGLSGCAIDSEQVRSSQPTAVREYQADAKALSDCVFQDLSAAEPDFPHRRFRDAQGFHVDTQLSDASEHPDKGVILDVLAVPSAGGVRVEVRSFENLWGGHSAEPKALWQIIDRCGSAG